MLQNLDETCSMSHETQKLKLVHYQREKEERKNNKQKAKTMQGCFSVHPFGSNPILFSFLFGSATFLYKDFTASCLPAHFDVATDCQSTLWV